MEDLKLEKDEGILLIATEAWRYFDDNELAVDTLYLTNQNLISVYKKSNGIFSKRESVIDKIPLTSISIINDVVQVKKVKDDDYGETLQIIFDDGKKELLEFTESPKKEYQQWEIAISNAVLECNGKRNTDNQDQTIAQNSPMAEINETVNLSTKETRFCSFCGTKLDPDARFCKSCGTPLDTVSKPKQIEESCKEEQYQQSTYFDRRQEFAGKIIKCPNCGEVLSSFVALCPACGHELRDIETSNLIKNFSVKIEQMASDEQKATLIRNFPISNTKEDIFEFMILASSNIVGERNEEVFNAWLAKFEQCYQKAVLTFANSPDFTKIQNIYEQTSKQVSKEKTMHRINKTGTVVSKFTSTFPNPIFGIVFILLLIWEIIRIVNGDFIGLDIIMVAIILRCVYKITNKNDKKKKEE